MYEQTSIQTRPKLKLNRNWFNPLYFILNEIIKENTIRTVLVYGGKSSSKTVSIAQITAKQAVTSSNSTIAFRKEGSIIKTTLKKSYDLAINSLRLRDAFERLEFMYRSVFDSEIVLKGLDTEEKAKGIESYKYLNLDELNHFEPEEYDQFQMSLRGMPGQKLFGSWNPISETSWVKKSLIDQFEFVETAQFGTLPGPYSSIKVSTDGTTVLIKTTYHDNYWIVGSPDGTYGFRDENLIKYYEGLKTRNFNAYRVNVLGEWGAVQTGNEFWKQFDETRHVKQISVDTSTTIHVSLDENVNPYVTQSIWQVFPAVKKLKQVHEILSKSPDNNAPKSALQFSRWLKSINYNDVVFVYGDPSASRRSTVDENSASFYQKYIEVLVKEGFRVQSRVIKSAPEVALSAAFINDIYESNLNGWEITISDKCLVSIEDYLLVKEDAEGKMLKEKVKDKVTGITYEPRGHLGDAKRYMILEVLKQFWLVYKTKGRRQNVSGFFH